MGTRFTRLPRGTKPANVVECYPSEFGGVRHRYQTDARAPAEDREPRAYKCYQCGLPIEDVDEVSVCPFCGSDNILGRRL